jgi:hypothetical protein
MVKSTIMKKNVVLIIGLITLSFCTQGQSVDLSLVSSTAGKLISDGLKLDFSLGEIAIESFRTQDLFLTQGFLQPEKAVQISIKESTKVISFDLYPNPAVSTVNVEMDLEQWLTFGGDIQMELLDVNGRLIQYSSISQPIVKIDLDHIMSGVYYVVISSNRFSFREVHVLQKVKY